MKLILIDIILASWLLIIVESLDYFPRQSVESLDYFPRQVMERDVLPYQPFIPGFRGYSSKNRFYQAVINYPDSEYNDFSEYQERPERPEYQGRPERPEHQERPERPEYQGRPEYSEYSDYHRKGPCSGTKSLVKEAVEFCSHVMKKLKKLKERLQGCDEVETPVGKLCGKDNKCYVVSEYYNTAQNMMYDAYQNACPCPQKHFTTGAFDLGTYEENNENVLDFLMCLGQTDPDGLNEVVLSVTPNSNECISLSYGGGGGDAYIVDAHDCTPVLTPLPPKKFLFVCEVPCTSPSSD